eukprot:1347694-Rhodomonas_salina.2
MAMTVQASRRVQAVCPQLSDYTEAVRVLVSTKMERLSHLAFSGWQQHGPGGLLLQMPTPTIAACESLLASARSAADAELQREGGDEADLADTFAQFDPSRHFLVACQLWARGRSKRSHLWFDFSPGRFRALSSHAQQRSRALSSYMLSNCLLYTSPSPRDRG